MRCEVLLFDGFDELDALAPWEVLSSFADVRDDLDAALVTLDGSATVRAAHGTLVTPHRALSDDLDVLVVPGGGWNDRAEEGAWAQAQLGALPRAIRERHERGAVVASVCTGAMLLAAAGLLEGRHAITHHGAIADLEAAGAHVVRARVVDDGDSSPPAASPRASTSRCTSPSASSAPTPRWPPSASSNTSAAGRCGARAAV